MTKEQIQAEIKKVESNKFLPQAVKDLKIKKLKDQLFGIEINEPIKGGSSTGAEEREKLKKEGYKEDKKTGQFKKKAKADKKGTKGTKTPAGKVTPDEALTTLIDKLTDLGIDLEGEEEESVAGLRMELQENRGNLDKLEDVIGEYRIGNNAISKETDKEIEKYFKEYYKSVPEPEMKARKTKSGGKKKKNNSKDVKYTYKGREIKELTEEDCEELRKDVAERRQKQAKAEKKSKSKPVIEKVAKNVVQGVKQAVKNVSAADIKDDPKGELDKMAKVEKLTRKFLSDLRAILGDDYDKDAVEGEMKELHDLIGGLKKKYGK